MPLDQSKKWGWKHVHVFGTFDRGSGTKRWRCNYCNQCYNGSYSRVRAHLLGFNGLGVKPCVALDVSTREAFKLMDKQHFPKRLFNKISSSNNAKKRYNVGTNLQHTVAFSTRNQTSENVDDAVARFCYMDALNLNVINSTCFREMAKAIGTFGLNYEPPSTEQLSGCLLMREKLRLQKVLTLARESWPHTGCTILCVNRLDSALGCFCVNFFVASPRVVMFLKEVDIIGSDNGPDNLFITELTNVIEEVSPSNVLQIITRLGGQASDVFESLILSKFPHIFWSHCTSHSILLLLEEIAELDWMKDVVIQSKEIEHCVSIFDNSSICRSKSDIFKGSIEQISQKFAPSYSLVKRVFETKASLSDLVHREVWKQWRLGNATEIGLNLNVEAIIENHEFWERAGLMVQVYEPFLRLLGAIDIDKSIMGDVYNWRVLAIEALQIKGVDEKVIDQLNLLLQNRWDKLFSPLHGAAYILNPRYFGKDQSENISLMRAWNTTLERYESRIETRRGLSEELGRYWRVEAVFGEEDAVECRDKLDPISWWENFGFETPRLQTLAVKILSQIPSAAIMCQENWQLCDTTPCREAVQRLGFEAEQATDFVFVRNNLKLQNIKYGKASC